MFSLVSLFHCLWSRCLTVSLGHGTGDGVVSKTEFLASGGTLEEFVAYDIDGNGVLDAHEFEQRAADHLYSSWENGSDSSEDFSSESSGVGMTQEQIEHEERQQIILEAIALDMAHRKEKDETILLQLLTKQLPPKLKAVKRRSIDSVNLTLERD